MPLAGFEPAIPESTRQKTHALDCAFTGIGKYIHKLKYLTSWGCKRVSKWLINPNKQTPSSKPDCRYTGNKILYFGTRNFITILHTVLLYYNQSCPDACQGGNSVLFTEFRSRICNTRVLFSWNTASKLCPHYGCARFIFFNRFSVPPEKNFGIGPHRGHDLFLLFHFTSSSNLGPS
jgi:hypothetical protein